MLIADGCQHASHQSNRFILDMFKILLILFILFYLFTKVGGYILKSVLGKMFSQHVNNGKTQYQRDSQYKQPVDGNVRIDHIPNEQKSSSGSKDGDYVDYEEVK